MWSHVVVLYNVQMATEKKIRRCQQKRKYENSMKYIQIVVHTIVHSVCYFKTRITWYSFSSNWEELVLATPFTYQCYRH